MKYVSVREMITIEKAADAQGHSYQLMMENAGKGLAEIVQEKYNHLPGKRITALVGSGNNGGDALVALDYLLSWGWQASALLFRNRPSQDELIERVEMRGGRILNCSVYPQSKDSIQKEISAAEIVLDGVLGTGFKLPILEPLNSLLDTVRLQIVDSRLKPVVIAVDCPSGMDCDTGEVDQACLTADLTATMAAVKQGLLMFPAANYVGDIQLVDIGLPPGTSEMEKISREVIESDWVMDIIPKRPLNAHKGSFGTALVIAGSENYPGAAILAAQSTYRIGTGLVTLAVPRTIYTGIISTIPEATWLVLDDQDGAISSSAAEQIKKSLRRPTACLIGPGLGVHQSTREFLEKVLRLKDLPPLVLDADGLRLAADLKNWFKNIPPGSVLTPHPGEMSILTGLSVSEVEADRIGIAETFARKWNQILVLKGAHTVIANPGGQSKILASANPALASAGTGDVLAGIITGLIAQGVSPFEAAAGGAWIHAKAGSIADKKKGTSAAVLAGDVSMAIGSAMSG